MAMKKPSSIDEPTDMAPMPEEPKPALLKSRTDTFDVLSITPTVVAEPCYDIEHVPVENDPRAWSNARKISSLVLISFASTIATLGSNIQNPAVEQMEASLQATSSQFSLSISTYILIQGLMSLTWSAISEVKGRKLVYITSLGLFTLASIILALSRHIEAVIGFRALQAAGSSAVLAIGAASLADIFEPEERGRKMGIYYVAPLLGPAFGPVFGGVFTSVWGWRAIFWFLALAGGLMFLTPERSLTYQNVLKKRLQNMPTLGEGENKSGFNLDVEKNFANQADLQDKRKTPIKLSITDVNPLTPLMLVVRRKNNFLVLLSSGLLFAYGFLISYATARTLDGSYGYDPLKIGLVTLSYGAGCMFGSVLGGRWSDKEFALLKAANGGLSYPEMRLKSTLICACIFPFSAIIFGWICQKVVHISLIILFLFAGGFLNIWIYSITLAYIVDANPGRSSTAVAANSAFRGVLAFVSAETAVPLQDNLGDVVAFAVACMLLVWWKGALWREQAESLEKER
ncbi:major facilitator superfamily domain-containing protein [Gymnopilus junonius]|uniref:Major facilitator superfamily domain-containing protein n=1 Tax=Gymnopilus junonius TaxID=109634 RepID=A0A9P5NHV7_GYMJU|nr:major facilitator superfamily domain-containing protein [Gymnopilus junonius]